MYISIFTQGDCTCEVNEESVTLSVVNKCEVPEERGHSTIFQVTGEPGITNTTVADIN